MYFFRRNCQTLRKAPFLIFYKRVILNFFSLNFMKYIIYIISMFEMLFGITMIKSMRPIFRKNVMQTIDSYSFLLLNTLFIAIFVMMYFIYLNSKNVKFMKVVENCKSLNTVQMVSMMLISFLTISSTILIMNMDQSTLSTTTITVMKSLSTVILVLLGIFLYKEKYNFTQIYGVILTIIGVVFISNK
jgi:drug/metabolite transporter (DMT)-like permease